MTDVWVGHGRRDGEPSGGRTATTDAPTESLFVTTTPPDGTLLPGPDGDASTPSRTSRRPSRQGTGREERDRLAARAARWAWVDRLADGPRDVPPLPVVDGRPGLLDGIPTSPPVGLAVPPAFREQAPEAFREQAPAFRDQPAAFLEQPPAFLQQPTFADRSPAAFDGQPTTLLPEQPAGAATRGERSARKRAMGRTRGRTVPSGIAKLAGSLPLPDKAIFGPVTLSRRQALLGAATLAAGATGAAVLLRRTSASGSDADDPAAAGNDPSGDGVLGQGANSVDPVALPKDLDPEHVLRRVTYAPTDAMRAEVAKLGLGNWLALQLEPAKITDKGGDAVGAMFPELGWSLMRAKLAQASGKDFYEWQRMTPLNHLGRAIWSNRQLFEVMVDFWSNHLNVTAPGEKGAWARALYDRDVIRKYALGRFEDMLVASSVHPAMLDYLDNANSTKRQPNENYARELLELHTVGVDGGYTEKDVKQAALLLTGWQLDDDGGASWKSDRHYTKPVTVMGVKYANGNGATGRNSALGYVKALASHPSTARYLARKLAIRFVADDPPAALVDKLAATYLAGGTAIVPVLRQLFASPEFAASAGTKLRRPMERLVAGLRTLGVGLGEDPQGMVDLYYMLETSGHKPLAWPMPNGYPDVAAKWQSPAAALEQLNATAAVVHGWWPNKLALPGPKKLLPKPPRNRAAVIDAVGKKVLGRLPTDVERNAVNTLLAGSKLPRSFGSRSWEQEETMALAAVLMMTSPAFLTR